MGDFQEDIRPPPVPRLVFAEDVDKRLREKRSGRDKEKEKEKEKEKQSSDRESYQSSDTERRSRREKFEESLKGNTHWNIEDGDRGGSSSHASSSDSIPSPTPLLPARPSPTVLPVKRTPPSTAQALPSLEPIPQVLPRIQPEPERSEDHGPDPMLTTLPAALAQHFEHPPSNSTRDLVTTCLCVLGILLLPIIFVIFLSAIPLEGNCCNFGDNLVYLLVYQPLWSCVVGIMIWMWLEHQLSILHPDSICYSPKRQILFCMLVGSYAFLVPTFYVVISAITGDYPLRAAGFVIVPPLLLLLISFYFCVTNSEGRALPGFMRNFFVHILVILLLQMHLGVVIAFAFFFPQVGTFIQIIVAVAYHFLTCGIRWFANYTVSKLTFKSFDKYKKGGRDYNNRSDIDLKGAGGGGTSQAPSAYSTATRTQSLFLHSFLTSLSLTSTSHSITQPAQPPPPLNPYLSSCSLQYFLINLHGTSFWPLFFLTYTVGWESFVLQLVCVLVIFSFYPLRLTDFWFHFSAKSSTTSTHHQRKIWNIAELTTKVDMLEYRKKVCAEFAFHFMSEAISLIAFIVLQFPICAGRNRHLYILCDLPNPTTDRLRAAYYCAITFVGLCVIFAVTLGALRKYARMPLRALFAPWQQFVNTYFVLLVIIATGTLVYPYQFSLAMNRMVHVQ